MGSYFHPLFKNKSQQHHDALQIIQQETATQWKLLLKMSSDVIHSNKNKNKMKRKNGIILNKSNTIYSKREQYLSKNQDLLFETYEKY